MLLYSVLFYKYHHYHMYTPWCLLFPRWQPGRVCCQPAVSTASAAVVCQLGVATAVWHLLEQVWGPGHWTVSELHGPWLPAVLQGCWLSHRLHHAVRHGEFDRLPSRAGGRDALRPRPRGEHPTATHLQSETMVRLPARRGVWWRGRYGEHPQSTRLPGLASQTETANHLEGVWGGGVWAHHHPATSAIMGLHTTGCNPGLTWRWWLRWLLGWPGNRKWTVNQAILQTLHL